MLNATKKFFSPPTFEDEEISRRANWLNIIAWFLIVIRVIVIVAPTSGSFVSRATSFDNIHPLLFAIVALILNKRGYVQTAAFIILIDNLFGIAIYFSGQGGLRSPFLTALAFLLSVAALIIGERGALGFTVLILMTLVGFAIADNNDLITSTRLENTRIQNLLFGQALIFISTGFIIWLTTRSLMQSLKNARQKELEVRALASNLEKRVDERTAELVSRTSALEKQTRQLQTVASVARAIASVQTLDNLLPEIARLVSEQFDFYHVGIFLLDQDKKNAVLRASNSEGGQRMLRRQHQLKLDANSIVGYATSRGEPRIALDVGVDAVFFNNPDLPDTHSEMALPLRIGADVIGALDVQSTHTNAFSEQDIVIISTLADQIAIAIENTRLFSESREALKESEEAFVRYVRREWSSFATQAKSTGYLFDGNRTISLDAKDRYKKIKSLPQTGQLVLEKDAKDLTIPIRLRGQIIGVLEVKPKVDGRQWTQDDMLLLEAASERAALALENARLVETSERRASRERTISEISTRIGAVSDLDAIMQAAVEELGRKIGNAAEVTLELDTEQDKS
ncbi:MAG: GAF domain-containing protein [Anaerolineales bacterium]|nr:GAF domain-containing protein [Anaerolineales bacterium]